MRNIQVRWCVALAGLSFMGCGDESSGSISITDGETIICYRGERVSAANVHGKLLIEGDIVVHDSDLWCESTSNERGVIRQSVRIQGASYRWPGGVVPYEFGSDSDATDQDGNTTIDPAPNFTDTQRQTIVDAMKEWAADVPGLTFRAATSSDTNRLRFEPDSNGCNSSVGRVGSSAQLINVPTWCLASKSLHHEIAHALGFYHQHTRKDRDAFITINWGNIKGCRSTATSSANCGASACTGNLANCGCTDSEVENHTCYRAHNFVTNNSRANILGYDYGSVMHYTTSGFSKGGQTITPPAGVTIGQRVELSELDLASMRAAYPVARLHSSVIYNHGVPAQLCKLDGREQDAATSFRVGVPGNSKSFAFNGNTETFASYSGIRVVQRQCDARSNFWAKNYDYPNSDSSQFGGGGHDESFSVSGTVVALHVALAPVLL